MHALTAGDGNIVTSSCNGLSIKSKIFIPDPETAVLVIFTAQAGTGEQGGARKGTPWTLRDFSAKSLSMTFMTAR